MYMLPPTPPAKVSTDLIFACNVWKLKLRRASPDFRKDSSSQKQCFIKFQKSLMLAPSPWPGGAPGGSFRFSPSPAPPAVAQCGPALVPGLRVEAEWVPGRWHCGQVVEVAPDGAVTIRYDDGYLQKNVAHGKVRAAANGPAIASGPLRAGVPPPPPPAVYPWPEDGTAKPGAPCGEQVYVNGDEDPECTKKFRKRLSIAVDKGRTEEVQALLLDAHKVGLQGPEVRWARDVLLAAEAAEFRKSAVMLVEDAVESGDYWKLQAAMQAAVGCGLGAEQAPRLKQAMRTHKARSEASRELRRAAQVRDVPRLRTAIEGALKVHLEEDVVKRARATLRALQARESARKELRRAAEAKDMTRLKAAIIAAEKSFQEKVPEMCGDDPKEKQELDAARAALRTHAMSRLSRLADAEDIESLGKGLQELSGHGVPAEEWQQFEQRHSQLKTRQRCQDTLAQATKARDKDAILAAMEDAKVVLEQNSEVIEIAQKTVSMLEAEETMAKTRAEVAEELTRSVHGEDQRRLIAALTAADAAGFTSSEVAFARERLRRLRARVGAAQELREAAHSADMYRFTLALAHVENIASVASGRHRDVLQDHRRVVGHVKRGLQQEPAGSAGALADFVGQRIYFTTGNAPTIDVPSVCGGTLLSECVQRRNESLLPKGCFTLEYLGVVSLVLNPGGLGGETLTCQQPAFCDNICVKLPPEPPTTTLPVTDNIEPNTDIYRDAHEKLHIHDEYNFYGDLSHRSGLEFQRLVTNLMHLAGAFRDSQS
eukprot:s1629_g11.t1